MKQVIVVTGYSSLKSLLQFHTYCKKNPPTYVVEDVDDEIIQGKFYEPELVKFVTTNFTRTYERTCLKLPDRVTSTNCQNQTFSSPQDMTASGSAEFTLNLFSNASMEKFPGNKLSISQHSYPHL